MTIFDKVVNYIEIEPPLAYVHFIIIKLPEFY